MPVVVNISLLCVIIYLNFVYVVNYFTHQDVQINPALYYHKLPISDPPI